MIFGQPYEFAIFYSLLEKTDDSYWKFGVFIFFIEDKIYPTKGSNYTLSMVMDHLKDSHQNIINCKAELLDISMGDYALFKKIAHSHNILLDNDPVNLELPDVERLGVFLSPLEISDAGFYLFYFPGNEGEEYLIYSSDYGNTAQRTVLNKGTVSDVLMQLPNKDAIN